MEEVSTTPKTKKVKIHLTRTGHPAVWEYGGSHGQTGHCQIIAGKDGRDLVPLFIITPDNKRVTPNGWQALFGIKAGMLVIRANRRADNCVTAEVLRINSIDTEAMKASGIIVGQYSSRRGGWDEAGKSLASEFPKVQEALNVAVNKCSEFQCTRAMYYRETSKED